MTLGDKIQNLRQTQGLSQKELAEKIEKTTVDIALWESNEDVPSIADIAKLSVALSVTTDSLIVGSDVSEAQDKPSQSELVNDTDSSAPKAKKKKSKKKLAIIIPACVLLVAIIAFLSYEYLLPFLKKNIETLPFSKDTAAIEKATSSVVKIYCYNHEGKEIATGSGFIAFDDRTVVTNYHVMKNAYTCKISTEQDKTYEVKTTLAYSKEQDIAIVRLKESTGLEVLELGDSGIIKKGEVVTAIGSPLGIKNTVSQGVLSGRIMGNDMDILQFTAAISSGSSGGALFDENGKVIGVTYASFVDGQNLNLAIPAEIVKEVKTEGEQDKTYYSASQIYNEEHPYVAYLSDYSDAIEVTFEDLKYAPLAYKGKLVKIDTYISSCFEWRSDHLVVSYYFSNKENVSGDHDYDESLRVASGVTIPYTKVPVMLTSMVSPRITYWDDEIKVGDNVVIIGYFDYARVGDKHEVYGTASRVEYGTIDVEMIYRK